MITIIILYTNIKGKGVFLNFWGKMAMEMSARSRPAVVFKTMKGDNHKDPVDTVHCKSYV